MQQTIRQPRYRAEQHHREPQRGCQLAFDEGHIHRFMGCREIDVGEVVFDMLQIHPKIEDQSGDGWYAQPSSNDWHYENNRDEERE